MTPLRIQRKRTKGWRMPEGAVYVGRPSLFGNPWTWHDAPALVYDDTRPVGARLLPWGRHERQQWAVDKYRGELDHQGLLSDYGWVVSDKTWEAMAELADRLCPTEDAGTAPSIRPLFRHLLRDATALACWCPLEDEHGNHVPCHADVLIELLEATA